MGEESALIDFRLQQVHLVELADSEENDPFYSIKRYLGDLFFGKEEDFLSAKELKDRKFTWGYFSVPREEDENH